ncbi:MAG: SDR family oxidoreductase, partial [Planctomycetota bacterium]
TYAAAGVRVNVVSPGLVQTELTQQIWQNERSAAASVGMHPVGRLGESQDIASAIHWFLQPENSWVTGQNLAVDGGLSGLKTMAR